MVLAYFFLGGIWGTGAAERVVPCERCVPSKRW